MMLKFVLIVFEVIVDFIVSIWEGLKIFIRNLFFLRCIDVGR